MSTPPADRSTPRGGQTVTFAGRAGGDRQECRVGAERTHTPHAVMEAVLAHVVRNKAEAACARSDLFEKRRALMECWAAYLVA